MLFSLEPRTLGRPSYSKGMSAVVPPHSAPAIARKADGGPLAAANAAAASFAALTERLDYLSSGDIELVRRACQRQLMISTQGVASARVDEQSFLITPTNYDRPSLTNEGIVLIRDGEREAGKLPSRSVRLHEAIYQHHPRVQCILTSQAPYITAYAIAERPMDTKTIPESYIMLMDVPKLPYGSQYTAPETIAGMLSPQTPVMLLQNDCVLTTGSSVMQAFDRLEVAEFTARSLIETASIGKLVAIGADEIEDFKHAFARLMNA